MRDNRWNEVNKPSLGMIQANLAECLQESDADERPEAPVALAAIAYWRKLVALRIMTEEDCERRLADEDARKYIADFASRYQTAIERIVAQMGVEELQAAILGAKPDIVRRRELSPSAARLALRLLDIHDGETVLCGGASLGKFIEETCVSFPHVRLTFLEEDRSLRRIWNIRAAVMGWPVQVMAADISSAALKDFHADKIFLDAAAMSRQFDGIRERLRGRLAGARKRAGTDNESSESGVWAPLFAALQKQMPGGKTIGIVIKRDLTETSMSGSREKLVRKGWAESVVALPEDLDGCRIMQPYFVVCGEDCSTVRMVDASDVHSAQGEGRSDGVAGGRLPFRKTFTEEDIDTILQRLEQDGDRSRALSSEELAGRGYMLLPDADFLADQDFIYHGLSDGVPLQKICKIYRGAVASSRSSLESKFSETPTPFQYLQLKDVQAGFIRGPLPYLQGLDKKQEAYCAKNGVLVMGKNAPLRVGMLKTPENTKVLLGGNIYALEVDSKEYSKEYDPTYVMMYLQSTDGMRQMQFYLDGMTAVQVIALKDLENIKIPRRPLKEQQDVVAKYCARDEEKQNLLEKIEKIEKEMSELILVKENGHDE